ASARALCLFAWPSCVRRALASHAAKTELLQEGRRDGRIAWLAAVAEPPQSPPATTSQIAIAAGHRSEPRKIPSVLWSFLFSPPRYGRARFRSAPLAHLVDVDRHALEGAAGRVTRAFCTDLRRVVGDAAGEERLLRGLGRPTERAERERLHAEHVGV